MTTRIKLIILLATLWLGITADAQVMTLDTVLHTIARHNPMLKEYDVRAKALHEYARGARSMMAPMVGGGTFMTPYGDQMLMDERDKGAWMLSFEQEITNPAKLSANSKFLTSKASLETERRATRLNELRSTARTAYYQWLVAERKIKILKENEHIVDLMLRLARIRYPYNQGSLSSIYMAEGRLSEIQNMIEMTTGTIEESAFVLKSLMNLPADTQIMVDTSTIISFEPNLRYDTASLGTRSDIREMEKSIELMRLNQQLQRSQALPDFKIRFDHMQPVGNMPRQFSAMAMISIPIAPWSSKMYRSEVKGMQYDIDAMKEGRSAILNETRGMLAGMASQITRMSQQLKNYEARIIPALRKNYETTMIAYEQNLQALPAVVDAWEALNMSQMEFIEKKQEYLMMIVRYEKELEK